MTRFVIGPFHVVIRWPAWMCVYPRRAGWVCERDIQMPFGMRARFAWKYLRKGRR